MQGEVRQFFALVFVQRTDKMNSSAPRLHRFPVSLVNRVLCTEERTRLCLATRTVCALALRSLALWVTFRSCCLQCLTLTAS
jgi:hypothetical protein